MTSAAPIGLCRSESRLRQLDLVPIRAARSGFAPPIRAARSGPDWVGPIWMTDWTLFPIGPFSRLVMPSRVANMIPTQMPSGRHPDSPIDGDSPIASLWRHLQMECLARLLPIPDPNGVPDWQFQSGLAPRLGPFPNCPDCMGSICSRFSYPDRCQILN